MPKIELTCMVMICDKENNRVLVQDRVKGWTGVSFPGGHVEERESLVDAAIREVKEETGLSVSDLEPCGVVHFYNTDTGDRYMVFNFRTSRYSGELLEETDEGTVFWVNDSELQRLNLASGFAERLPMFFEGKYIESFVLWNEDGLRQMRWFEHAEQEEPR